MNVNILKLRLDQVRELGSLEDILVITDRLPRGIIAFFDAELNRLSFSDPNQRRQALIALIASSEEDTIALDELEKLLHASNTLMTESTGDNYHHVQQVLDSTRGLLCRATDLTPSGDESEDEDLKPSRHRVLPYQRDLWSYIREDYNEDLVLAKEDLRKIKAKMTALDKGLESTTNGNIEMNHSSTYTDTTSKDAASHSDVVKLNGGGAHESMVSNPSEGSNTVCTPCRQTFLHSKKPSGIVKLSDIGSKISKSFRCAFCNFIRKHLTSCEGTASNLSGEKVASLQWSIRTMGRTSNDRNFLTLTIRSDSQSGDTLPKRLTLLPKSEIDHSLSGMKLGSSTKLRDSGRQILTWLRKCDEEHVHCSRKHAPAYVPKRLVDIDTGVKDLYKVVLAHEQGISVPYVTLSHSWGRATFLSLVPENEDTLMNQGFSSSDLKNKNFVEAIELARFIGVEYIWD